jgi:hypothetical protein
MCRNLPEAAVSFQEFLAPAPLIQHGQVEALLKTYPGPFQRNDGRLAPSRPKNRALRKKSKIAVDVNTYGARIARIIQGCLLLVLYTRPSSSQANPASAQDPNVQIEVNVNSAAEQANPSPPQEPKAPETPAAVTGQSTAPGPNRPVQLIPRSAEVRERTYRAEHHVVLNVFVADASGNPVMGLKQEDFILLDDQQPQQITSFKAVTGSTAFAPIPRTNVLGYSQPSLRDWLRLHPDS